MARLRYNGLSTTLGGSLTNVATSVTFAAALTHSNGTNVPTIVSPDYIPLAILGATGHLSEIVYLTAYTAAGTTGTITRGQENTTAVVHSSGDTVTGAALVADSSIFSGFYGDGSDGNVTITTTVTLAQDMFYDTLTINSPGILQPNGFRVFCKTALVLGAGGTLRNNGNSASGATAGTANANASGTLTGGGSAGGAGGTAAGTSGTGPSNSFGGNSGAGGLGASGAGGFGRTITSPNAPAGSLRSLPTAAMGVLLGGSAFAVVQGGASGGGGGGDSTNAGGGGGGGGGILVLNARAITNNGAITATGGAGGNPSAGNTGGGGGGGGGLILVNTSVAITGSSPTAAGGAGGTKQGTGVNGVAGSSGSVLLNVWI